MAVLSPWTQIYNQNHHIIFLNVNISYFMLCLNMTLPFVWCFPLVFLPLKDQTVDALTRKITGNQGNCWLVHINETLTLGRHFNQCLLFRGEPMIVTIIGDIQTPFACLPVEFQPKLFGSSISQQNNFFFLTQRSEYCGPISLNLIGTQIPKWLWWSESCQQRLAWAESHLQPARVAIHAQWFRTFKTHF